MAKSPKNTKSAPTLTVNVVVEATLADGKRVERGIPVPLFRFGANSKGVPTFSLTADGEAREGFDFDSEGKRVERTGKQASTSAVVELPTEAIAAATKLTAKSGKDSNVAKFAKVNAKRGFARSATVELAEGEETSYALTVRLSASRPGDSFRLSISTAAVATKSSAPVLSGTAKLAGLLFGEAAPVVEADGDGITRVNLDA